MIIVFPVPSYALRGRDNTTRNLRRQNGVSRAHSPETETCNNNVINSFTSLGLVRRIEYSI